MASPVHALNHPEFKNRNIRVVIKRDDLIYGPCHGNKFRKLKFHLKEFKQSKKKKLLTFGGAFSNHLYATAATGFQLNIPTIGILRGEIDEENPTIKKIRQWGMHLHPMQRSLYAKKGNSEFIEHLQTIYPDAYIIPEGGHHSLAQKGVGELVREVRSQVPVRIDYWCCAYGTGSTALGILQELNHEEKLLAFLVLKGFNLGKTEDELVRGINSEGDRLRLVEAHLGGYGKKSPELEKFILSFFKDFRILLDPVYTGKMFFQLFSEIRNGNIPEGSTILAVHSGGLQGIEGYNYRYGSQLPVWKESYL